MLWDEGGPPRNLGRPASRLGTGARPRRSEGGEGVVLLGRAEPLGKFAQVPAGFDICAMSDDAVIQELRPRTRKSQRCSCCYLPPNCFTSRSGGARQCPHHQPRRPTTSERAGIPRERLRQLMP